MDLKQFLNSLKKERVVKRGDKKIPLSEVPSGESLKVGILLDGKWKNIHLLAKSDELEQLLQLIDKEGAKCSLEWL